MVFATGGSTDDDESNFRNRLFSYKVTVELYDVDGDDVTENGLRVRDLTPIDHCVLTPGDPSPIGRTPDGDLDYVERRDKGSLTMNRASAAALATLMARALDGALDGAPARAPSGKGESAREAWPGGADAFDDAIEALLKCAAPKVLFQDTAHAKMQRQAILKEILGAAYDPGAFLGYRPKT